jgi:hypothetical protein
LAVDETTSDCDLKNFDLESIVVTAPDPIRTHLALMFDRIIESVQWAAADTSFTFVRYSFPWREIPGLMDAILTREVGTNRRDASARLCPEYSCLMPPRWLTGVQL